MIWHEQLQILWKEKHLTNLEISKNTFTNYYQKIFKPSQGLVDLENAFEALNNPIIFFINNENAKVLNVRVYCCNDPLPLSVLVPTFENFGLKGITEQTHAININGKTIWYHLFCCEKYSSDGQILDTTINYLIKGLYAVWSQVIEDDSFNRLIVSCNFSYQQVIIFRLLSKYLTQIGFFYTQTQIARVLEKYPYMTKLLWHIFDNRFNPISHSQIIAQKHIKNFLLNLKQITKIEDDRVLTVYLNLILAMIRTNAYQGGNFLTKPYVSCKFHSALIKNLKPPVPLYEIFVYSTTMEGCHLRGGKVARGGIRWSDRFNDFRQEILDLMKAQMVKNAVIVPVGAKGGFVVKKYNTKEDAINAYKTLIMGMLDLTDNLVCKKIQKPKDTICYDEEDDHYLVVGADKGTTNFSDIANNIAKDYNFWLQDAFASGGSQGYNHKSLAITAKGAWISVQNHFNSLMIDCQTSPITVLGVGDMSGDVFGNGMIQSSSIKLIGAFNHSHIFLDPTPDTLKSYHERLRLFNITSSTWDDYDKNLISSGGGVFLRNTKFITLSKEIRSLLQIEDGIKKITPDDLIKIMLKAPIDLIWFGGIGTFIKGSTETNNEVGNQQNYSIRIDANQVQAKVIGEGANLGVTQRGRIEFALNGGKINTDAIDNSGGVDCSDHEVNLKILLHTADKKITIQEREQILKELTQDISSLVLKDNFNQNIILNKMEGGDYLCLLHELEKSKNLSRSLEFLPDDKTILHRKFTRPELAILMAYSKIHLKKELSHTLNLKPNLYNEELQHYFPTQIQNKFPKHIAHHPLGQAIVINVLVNDLINKLGINFVPTLEKITASSKAKIVENFCEIKTLLHYLNLDKLWDYKDWPYLVSIITQIFLVLHTNTLDIIVISKKIKRIIKEWDNHLGFDVLEYDISLLPIICQLSLIEHGQKLMRIKNFNSLINLFDLQKRILKLTPQQDWQITSQIMGINKLIKLQAHLYTLPQKILDNIKILQDLSNTSGDNNVSQALAFMYYVIQKFNQDI